MDLVDPAGDQLLADRRRVGLGEEVLDLAVGRGRDPAEDLVRVVVAGLDALEVEDREPAEAASAPANRGSTTASIAEARIGMPSVDAAERLAELDVGRLDRGGPGRERDVLEAVGRAEGVDLGPEDPSIGAGAGGLIEQRGLLAAVDRV